MYTITLNENVSESFYSGFRTQHPENVLHDVRLSETGRVVLSPTLELSVNSAGSLSFTVPPTNPLYADISSMNAIVRVYKRFGPGYGDERLLFKGRVLNETLDFQKKKEVYCEGVLSFFLDSQQRPFTFAGSVADFLTLLVNRHNASVEEKKRFSVGTISVGTGTTISRESKDYISTLDAIDTFLVGSDLGGVIQFRESISGVTYIDYITASERQTQQVIKFGENLLDFSKYITAEDIYTVLIPLGPEQKDSSGQSLGRMTISSVNSGRDYLESSAGVTNYGKIERVLIFDNAETPAMLKSYGEALVNSGSSTATTITINAIDLSIVAPAYDEIEVGDLVLVQSPPHGVNQYFQCTSIRYDLFNPNQNEYSFGEGYATLTGRTVSMGNAIGSGGGYSGDISAEIEQALNNIKRINGGTAFTVLD